MEIGVNHKLLRTISIALQLNQPEVCIDRGTNDQLTIPLVYPEGNLGYQIRVNYVNAFTTVGPEILYGPFDIMGLITRTAFQDSMENLELREIYRFQWQRDPEPGYDFYPVTYDYDSCLDTCRENCELIRSNTNQRLGLWCYYFGLGVITYPVSPVKFAGDNE